MRLVLALLLLLVPAAAGLFAAADPIPVRFPEGTVHGFLSLKALDANINTTGDLLQQTHGDQVESRLLFRFKDGSLHDETTVFTQQKIFMMLSYHIVQRGAAFEEDLEASLDRRDGGRYTVKSRRRGEREKIFTGKLDLPADVYNGIVLTVVKDLPRGVSRIVRVVAFTPKPRVIDLELVPVGKEKITIGDVVRTTTCYAMKPRLGPLLGLFASVLGKKPRDYRSWFLMEDVPAFVRFEGSLYEKGHVWRIELTSPAKEK